MIIEVGDSRIEIRQVTGTMGKPYGVRIMVEPKGGVAAATEVSIPEARVIAAAILEEARKS